MVKDVECRYCKHCRPILKEGLVKSFNNVLPQKNLFNEWGVALYNTCAVQPQKEWLNINTGRTCQHYSAREITAADIEWWLRFIPMRWKKYTAHKWVTLTVTAGEDSLEIKYKAGGRDCVWVLKVGEPAEQFGPIFSLINTDAYNQAMVEADPLPPERSFWSYDKCDKEISQACYGYLGGTL